MSSIGLGTVLGRGRVSWAVADSEAVVYDATGSTVHVLDPIASLLWQCLDHESPLGDIFTDLADGFGVDPAAVAADCLPAIRSWLDAGIARSVPPAPPIDTTRRRLIPPPDA